MYKTLTPEEHQRLTDEYDKVKYRCKCGYRVIIPYNAEKNICQHCHRYVFKSKEDEFKYRMKERGVIKDVKN